MEAGGSNGRRWTPVEDNGSLTDSWKFVGASINKGIQKLLEASPETICGGFS